MESLKEGVKFVFNKTILGALSLDMIAVLLVELLLCCPFYWIFLKVGPQGFGVLRAAPAVGAFDADYFRLPLLKCGY
jgi:hypothetical protein